MSKFLVGLGLALAFTSFAWGKQEERAPLQLSGNLGFGVVSDQKDGTTDTGGLVSADADLAGYWRDPRILLFNFNPFVGYGSARAASVGVANPGKGFSASTTVLGGSSFPLNITYSRQWQDVGAPGSADVLAGVATSLALSNLAIDWGLHLQALPPVNIHYGKTDARSEFPTLLGGVSESHSHNFSIGTYYSLAGWQLDSSYGRTSLDATRPALANLGEGVQTETGRTEDYQVHAQRRLPLQSIVALSSGHRAWNNSTIELLSDNSYNYATAVAGSRPFAALDLNFRASYTSNESAAQIQQLVGVPGGNPVSGILLQSLNSGRSVLFGGGATYRLPYGFTVAGNVSTDDLSNPVSGNANRLQAGASLTYERRLARSGSLSASFAYERSQTESVLQTLNGTARTLRAGASRRFPRELQLSGSVFLDWRTTENSLPPAGTLVTPAHGHGVTLNAGRPLGSRWKLFGDFELSHSVSEFPVFYETNTKGFGIRMESRAVQLSVFRKYRDGLAFQVANGLLFVGNPQNALLTPLATVLSMSSNVQTTFRGSYQPGRQRLVVTGIWSRFGYGNKGIHLTDNNLVTVIASYRLRRLSLQGGYSTATSEVFAVNRTINYHRREIYFQVLRHFQLF